VAVLLIPFAKILSRIEVENAIFAYSTLILDPSSERQQYPCNLYFAEKFFSGLQFCRWNTGV